MVILAFWTSGQFFIEKAYTLLVFAGIWALMQGVTDIVRAFAIRGLRDRIDHAPAHALVDEVANELDTWPGVHIGRRADGAAIVRYESLELGVLYRDRGVAELSFWYPEHDALVEHGDAEPAGPAPESERVTHRIEGPSDVTAVLRSSIAATATSAARTSRTRRRTRAEERTHSTCSPSMPGSGSGSCGSSRSRRRRAAPPSPAP